MPKRDINESLCPVSFLYQKFTNNIKTQSSSLYQELKLKGDFEMGRAHERVSTKNVRGQVPIEI